MKINLQNFYSASEVAKLAHLKGYLAETARCVKLGAVVILTGHAPVWLYLAVAHALHGKAKRLYYESPVTGRVLIFDHDPH
jgi:hypothetical protein